MIETNLSKHHSLTTCGSAYKLSLHDLEHVGGEENKTYFWLKKAGTFIDTACLKYNS